MNVLRIRTENFRNLERQELELCEGTNVIFGKNAQGKTNLLEAVYLFTQGKSFRTNRDRDMVAFGKEYADVSILFHSQDRENEFSIRLFGDNRRREVRLNGVELTKLQEVTGNFYTVLFTPEHLNLVKEGPAERRKFLDTAICSLKPRYYKATEDYGRILTQKNALLKDLHRYPSLADTLSVWNDRLASAGAYITYMRASYIRSLAAKCAENHLRISGGRESLALEYQFFDENGETEPLLDLKTCKAALKDAIDAAFEEELRAGVSLVGPHRDDINILLGGKQARLFASQGQQRSIVLSMKLAESELVHSDSGEMPVLLLDDILSELDRTRQSYILDQITDKQVILTTCERTRYKQFSGSFFFGVTEGAVTKKARKKE